MTTMTDEQLVEKVRTHNRELFGEVVDRYQDKLLRYTKYLIHDEQKAQDVVQETFIKAFVNLNGFDIKKKFSSWIYRIAHNEAMNAVQKHKKETNWDETFDPASEKSIVDEITTKETVEKAQSCLSEMPTIYSEPLALFFLDEKSYEEISDILHIPMGTVATRINRAKLLMKKICQTKN